MKKKAKAKSRARNVTAPKARAPRVASTSKAPQASARRVASKSKAPKAKAPKTKAPKAKPARDIDEYIAGCSEAVRASLEKIRLTIQKAAPRAVEAIKYGMPTFTLQGNLVHFAAFKQHIGLYPAPSGAHAMKQFSAYAGPRGTVKFPLSAPIPYEVIRELVKLRVKEDAAAAAGKAK